MKIRIRKTDNCIVLEFANKNFYLANAELTYIVEKLTGMFSDCGNILQVQTDMIAFIESPGSRSEQFGSVPYVYIRMDTAKFFSRLEYLRRRGIISEDGIAMDTDSFANKPVTIPQLNFAQIFKHEAFKAHTKVKEALEYVPRKQMMRLREMISRLIFQGKGIGTDSCRASFYFYPLDGKSYNGGIIFHEASQEYSIHT